MEWLLGTENVNLKIKNEKKKKRNNKHPSCKDFIEFKSYGSLVCFVVNVAIALEGMMLKLKLQYFGHLM